jgi:hypothetical protein
MRKHGAASVPPMPTESKNKPLYVYSWHNGATIYANECILAYKFRALAYYSHFSRSRQQASSAAHCGLTNGSFRKVEITPRLSEAFAYSTASALRVIDISDAESDAESVPVINISDTESG